METPQDDSSFQDFIHPSYINVINSNIDVGYFPLASENARLALQLYPDDFQFQNLLGYILTNLGDYEEALELLLKSEPEISEQDDNGIVEFSKMDNWFCIAKCYIYLEQSNEALFYLRKLLLYYDSMDIYIIAHALYERYKIYLNCDKDDLALIDLNHANNILRKIRDQDEFEDPLGLQKLIESALGQHQNV